MSTKESRYPSKQLLTDNILACYYSSSIQERAHGKAWYSQAYAVASVLSKAYNIKLDIVCAVIAVLSPRNQWSRNVDDAENIIKRYCGNKDYESVKLCTFKNNKDKAISILETGDIVPYLRGLKVNAFYQCILLAGLSIDHVCIDGHAISIALGEKISLKNIPSRYFGKVGYTVMTEAYTHAANTINMANEYRTDVFLQPCQLQAITWIHHRRVFLDAYINDVSDSASIDAKIERIANKQARDNEALYND